MLHISLNYYIPKNNYNLALYYFRTYSGMTECTSALEGGGGEEVRIHQPIAWVGVSHHDFRAKAKTGILHRDREIISYDLH